MLTPAVDHLASLASFLPGGTPEKNVISRGVAVLLVYLGILAILVGLGLLVVPVAIEQGAEFVDQFPELRMRAQDQFNSWLEQYRERVPENVRERIDTAIADNADRIGIEIAAHTTDSFSVLTTTLGVIFGFLIVPFWLFYALRDRHRFEDNFAAAVPAVARPDMLNGIRNRGRPGRPLSARPADPRRRGRRDDVHRADAARRGAIDRAPRSSPA